MDTKGVGGVVVLLILGVFLGGMGFLPTYEHNVAVQEGEPTSAVVQSTDIEVEVDEEDDDRDYIPVVVYEYTVDGARYTSDNTFPGRFERSMGTRSSAEEVVDQYQAGQEVTIHYDPANPANAYLRDDGWPGSWWIGLGYALLALAAGGKLIRTGFRRWKQRQLIANTPTEKVRSLSVGRSELTGTAVTEDREPMRAPFSDDECVVAKYEVKEYDEDDDDDGGGSWKTVESDVLHVPFYVDDGTGSVLVEPHEEATFDLEPEDWSETYVDSGQKGPEPIAQFVSASDSLSFPSHSAGKDNDRKYRQNLIRTDESVYVFGQAQPRGVADGGVAQEDRLVIRHEDAGAMAEELFMISDDEEADLVDRRKWALWRGPVGGFFMVLGFAMLLGMFGPSLGLTLPVLF